MRVGKLLIFSYFINSSVTESIIKYLAKKTRRKKMDCAFEVYFLFAVKVAERYSPDKLESLPILFRYLRDQRDFKTKSKKWRGYWKSHSNIRTGGTASRNVWHLRPSCAESRLRIRYNSRFNFQVTEIEKDLWLHILQCDQPFPATGPMFRIWIISNQVWKLSSVI